ncbi:CHRD domain-containing protein [Lichenicoccus sp.]|uniref:CHRD domain-containing protein n=1 Tax=Lichenicoccus sp. TaxID=2781899 RepID=UPI003D130ED5
MSQLSRRLLLAAGFTVALGGAASAKELKVMGTFIADAGVTTQPTGDVTGSFNTHTHKLDFKVTYGGLSGPVVAAHFHGPAKLGHNAGVMIPIEKPYDSPITGSVDLSAKQTHALEHGLVYVNLHTQANPNGEARAQLHTGHMAMHKAS